MNVSVETFKNRFGTKPQFGQPTTGSLYVGVLLLVKAKFDQRAFRGNVLGLKLRLLFKVKIEF